MCVTGLGPTMIANRLKEMQILTPVMYEYRKSGTAVTALDTDRPYDWNEKTVVHNRAYTLNPSHLRFKDSYSRAVRTVQAKHRTAN